MGMCRTHYERKRTNQPLGAPIREVGVFEVCSVEGCGKPHSSKGYCSTHYARLTRTGTLADPSSKAPKVCGVAGCDKPHLSKGLCDGHYQRKRIYSLSVDELCYLLDQPCGICGSRENMQIDHDHSCCPGSKSCGKCVRGALCGNCNAGLGHFRDDVSKLRKAIEYLTAKNDVVLLAM